MSRLNQIEANLDIPRHKILEDIYGLRISSLPSCDGNIRQTTEEFLKSPVVTNQIIRNLYLTSKDEVNIESIRAQLLTMTPFFSGLAYEVVRNSPYGVLRSLQNQFTNITTLSKMAEAQEGKDFFSLCSKVNVDYREAIWKIFRRAESRFNLFVYEELDCPTFAAEYIRGKHWSLKIIASKKPLPLHQITIKPVRSVTISVRSWFDDRNLQ